ncbi:MAG TPA: 3D domain-containing protein [Pyrinomonadaceae bacterium]|nr:3D domain-containing protein [Pyrinomonadaceae bacterium]
MTFYSQTLIAADRPAAQDSQTTIDQTIITASHDSGKISGALAAALPVIAIAGVATEGETATTDAAPAVTVALAAPSPKAETEEAAPAAASAQTFIATAYALPGRTASGHTVRRGLIAADRHLPLGTRVRLEAGRYSGEYLVADRGGKVRGRVIDIWVPSNGEAVRFGRRPVKLTILKYGAKKAKRAGKAS